MNFANKLQNVEADKEEEINKKKVYHQKLVA